MMGEEQISIENLLSIARPSDDELTYWEAYIDIVIDEVADGAWVYGGSCT